MNKPRFEGRTAIVTGAASGIGLATAKRLASEGANVLIADLKADKAETAAKEIGGAAWSIACDVSNESQVEAAVSSVLDRHGRLDVIVNNAGLMIFKPVEEHTEDDWLKILRVDLLGAFFFTKQAFLKMKLKMHWQFLNILSSKNSKLSPIQQTPWVPRISKRSSKKYQLISSR